MNDKRKFSLFNSHFKPPVNKSSEIIMIYSCESNE